MSAVAVEQVFSHEKFKGASASGLARTSYPEVLEPEALRLGGLIEDPWPSSISVEQKYVEGAVSDKPVIYKLEELYDTNGTWIGLAYLYKGPQTDTWAIDQMLSHSELEDRNARGELDILDACFSDSDLTGDFYIHEVVGNANPEMTWREIREEVLRQVHTKRAALVDQL